MTVVRFDNFTDLQPLLADLLINTKRHLDIFSLSLRPDLFGDEQMLKIIADIARRNRNSRVRILLARADKNLRGHPLIALRNRLDSKIGLRIINEPDHIPRYGFMCADAECLLYFNDENQLSGFYNAEAKPEAKRLLIDFEQFWQSYSEEDPNLRRLFI